MLMNNLLITTQRCNRYDSQDGSVFNLIYYDCTSIYCAVHTNMYKSTRTRSRTRTSVRGHTHTRCTVDRNEVWTLSVKKNTI